MSSQIQDFYRGGTVARLDKNEPLIFQALTWDKSDVNDETTSDFEDDHEQEADGWCAPPASRGRTQRKMEIRVFGITQKGESVSLTIQKFEPYFFVKVPDGFQKGDLRLLQQRLPTAAPNAKKDLTDVRLVKGKELFYFTAEKDFLFFKLSFRNNNARWEYFKALTENPVRIPGKGMINFPVYEANLDPVLRFLDLADVQPTGWIKVDRKYLRSAMTKSECQFDFCTDWNRIGPAEDRGIAPMRVASFDIECTSADGSFPQAERLTDKIIQIGMTTRIYGSKHCNVRYIAVLGECNEIENVEHKDGFTEAVVVESFSTERALLLGFAKHVRKVDPDIMIGYNIFGFDWKYMWDRADIFNCTDAMARMGRITGKSCKLKEQTLQSSAMGTNFLHYPLLDGRVQIDLLKVVQREHNLSSYKLGNVSKHFLKNTKHDLPPDQIFKRFHRGTPEDIKVIAEYCIQDCILVNDLFDKLSILPNSIGMSNVCYIPLTFLFTRGQGIKCFALIGRTCRRRGTLFPTLPRPENIKGGVGYEGATVLDPTAGVYFKPIGVMDYGALYPSSMIAENISHETLVKDPKYLGLPGYQYNPVNFDLWEGTGSSKHKVGEKKLMYAEKLDADGKPIKGIIPTLLIDLLAKRRAVKKEMAKEKDPFKKSILNGLQLAYKITCNSVYGYLGATFSDLRMKDLAASTTAVGRRMLHTAKEMCETHFVGSKVVYGDTDSIFVDFSNHPAVKGKEGKEALRATIEIAERAADFITARLKRPQVLEYEKTFWPFMIITKKRYAGHLYEFDPDKYKFKSMGLVTKRRDNAPIVKRIYQGVLDILFETQDIPRATQFYQRCVKDLLSGNVDTKELILSKTLSASYKDPTRITHKMLAMRMTERDPGNAPASSERIPYIFIDERELKCKKCRRRVTVKNCKCKDCMGMFCNKHMQGRHHNCVPRCRKCWSETKIGFCGICTGPYCNKHREGHKCSKISTKALQGDLVETPTYIEEKGLRIDYRYYLDHQIANPVSQIFELIEETRDRDLLKKLTIEDNNRKSGTKSITHWFKPAD
jgi:DNA polymerase delta subunit 1